MTTANAKYKDTIFRKYFSDKKKLRSLYSALTDIPCEEIRQIDIKTLENIMFGKLSNDLAFLVNRTVIVVSEHMGSFSYNLPTRMLRYYSSLLDILIEVRKLFNKTLVKIPAPKFYILYNGIEDLPKEIDMKLSDAFLSVPDETCGVELKVKLININADAGHELLEKCPYIKEYALFISTVRGYVNDGQILDEAMKNAIAYCKSHGIMLDFLQEYGMEVQKMELGITLEELTKLRRQELYEEGHADGFQDGHAAGLKDGHAAGAVDERLKIAANLKSDGISVDTIAKNTGLTSEEIEKL